MKLRRQDSVPPSRQAAVDLQRLQIRSPGQVLSKRSRHMRQRRDLGSCGSLGRGLLTVACFIPHKIGRNRGYSSAYAVPIGTYTSIYRVFHSVCAALCNQQLRRPGPAIAPGRTGAETRPQAVAEDAAGRGTMAGYPQIVARDKPWAPNRQWVSGRPGGSRLSPARPRAAAGQGVETPAFPQDGSQPRPLNRRAAAAQHSNPWPQGENYLRNTTMHR